MNLDNHLRAVAVIAACALSSCVPEESDLEHEGTADERAEDTDLKPEDLHSKTAALNGNTSHCEDSNVLRWEFTYPDQYHGNMQAFSANLPAEQRDWWNRTDNCPALVVEWVRSDEVGQNNEQAYVAGITAPGLTTNPPDCALLWVSKKILTHYWVTSPGYWSTLVDKDEVLGEDCTYSFNGVLWLGTLNHYSGWFSNQSRLRAITQGFYYVFPVPVSAYMQTEDSSHYETCPTQCCYDHAWPLPPCSS